LAEPFAPSSERFDEVFTDVAAGRVVNELFDQVMGPFPSQVEPFSLVTREGLDLNRWRGTLTRAVCGGGVTTVQ